MNKNFVFKKWILPIISTLIIAGIWYYINFPAINIKSMDFWQYLIFIVVAFLILKWLFSRNLPNHEKKEVFSDEDMSVKIGGKTIPLNFKKPNVTFGKTLKIGGVIIASIIVILIAVWVSSSELFNAKSYHNQLSVENGNFSDDIAEISLSQIPVVDKETAIKLGNRKLGEVVSLVSQFEISDMYTQYNFNNSPTRVSPLMYSDIIKWFTNQSEGIPYYVQINMATQQTELVHLDNPIKYSIYEHFNRHLLRYLRFKYKTAMFDNPVFETDDSGKPYWVVPIYDYKIGLLGGKDITDILLVDAASGEITKYNVKDVPRWIDNVYPSYLLNFQANNWGKYGNGFFNSIFGQRDVITTTEGYNSLAINDDLWMYTGLTSVTGDKSNIGFILVNMRTKETKYYKINGADEESAMRSAEGKVQEKKYKASFPILVNIANRPTYFLSLKDDAGLIKQYAFISVEQYQIVGVGDTVSAAQDSYISQLKTNSQSNLEDVKEISGTISEINSAVVDANTNYYIKLQDTNIVYIIPISLDPRLALAKIGDTINIKYNEGTDATLRYASAVTFTTSN